MIVKKNKGFVRWLDRTEHFTPRTDDSHAVPVFQDLLKIKIKKLEISSEW